MLKITTERPAKCGEGKTWGTTSTCAKTCILTTDSHKMEEQEKHSMGALWSRYVECPLEGHLEVGAAAKVTTPSQRKEKT